MGISVRRFGGWEPHQVTRYEYGPDGAIVGWVTETEPEWDEHEQGWMLALDRCRSQRCGQCGGDLTETTDPANEDGYEYSPPMQCHRCVALSQAHTVYADEPHPMSLMHIVKRKPRR